LLLRTALGRSLPPSGRSALVFRTSLVVLLLAWVVPLPATPAEAAAGETSFIVIVHPEVQGTQIRRAILSSIFLGDVKRWGDGRTVHPVDRSLNSPLREHFTRQVLTVPPDSLQYYWNGKIMKGALPPPVKQTDEEVLEYVAKTQGAIGYVSADVEVPASVKPLVVID
jgi:ABC-type phosphate transport system substrate-binding protein